MSTTDDASGGPQPADAGGAVRWDNLLKAVTALVAIVGAIVGVANALGTLRMNALAAKASAENAVRETRKPFVEQMLPVYTELIDQTGKIASAANVDGGINDSVTTRFHELYCGRPRLYATQEVRDKLNAFEVALDYASKNTATPEQRLKNSSDLGRASMDLAAAMQRQIMSLTDIRF